MTTMFSLFNHSIFDPLSYNNELKEQEKTHAQNTALELIETSSIFSNNSQHAAVWGIKKLSNGNYTLTKQLLSVYQLHDWVYEKVLKNGINRTICYKTELCEAHFSDMTCTMQDCEFAHSIDELQEVLRHKKHKSQLCMSEIGRAHV